MHRLLKAETTGQLCTALLHQARLCPAAAKVVMTLPAICNDSQQSLASSRNALQELSPSLPVSSTKSAKRKAAEAFLQSCSVSYRSFADTPVKRRHLNTTARVHACSASHDHDSHAQASAGEWCDFDVCLPHLEWSTVVLTPAVEAATEALPHSLRMPIYTLTDNITVYVVERANQMSAAIQQLKDSMEDSVISIDLEWKPDFVRDTSKVALMQLSSSTCCLLIRLCKVGPELPEELLHFFRDPAYTFLGFAWDSSDEKKMQKTFKRGKSIFHNFLDLQDVAEQLGYHNTGLAKLTKQVLGCAGYKSKRVSMSNWEARKLNPAQVQYAALDALVTGQVFRGLRLWHSAPCACATCHRILGQVQPKPALFCMQEGCKDRGFGSLDSLTNHARKTRHNISVQTCSECGRMQLEAPGLAPPSEL